MASLRIRVQHAPRPPADDPALTEDELLGGWLVSLVKRGVDEGRAGPVAVVVRDRVVDLVALAADDRPLAHGFLAGLTASTREGDRARVVGLAGRFLSRSGPADRTGAPVAQIGRAHV